MKQLLIASRLRALEKEIVGAYVSGINLTVGYCLRIALSKADDDVNPSFLREMELTFSNVADCSLNLKVHPSLEISDGITYTSKSSLLDARDKRLAKITTTMIRPRLHHFKLSFNHGTCEVLARDFSLCVLSETPRAPKQTPLKRSKKNKG